MASFRKRGPYQWQARVKKKGYLPQSKTFNTRAEAEAWAREIESEMDRGVWRSRTEAESTTLGECLERYLNEVTPKKKGAKQERTRIQRLMAHPLAIRYMATLRGADMATYRDEKLAAGQSPYTINLDLAVLSHLFTIAIKEWGMESLRSPVSLIRRPRNPRGRDRRITPTEEQLLLNNARPGLRAAITLALETGMRESEIAGLKRADLDLDARILKLKDTKNNEQRLVPLSPLAIETIKSLPVRLDGRVIGMTAGRLAHAFIDLCGRVGIEGLRYHDLRHEATSRLFEKGLGLMEVATITGHKTLAILRRYTHLRAEDLAKKLG